VSQATSAFNYLLGLRLASDMGRALGDPAGAAAFDAAFASAAITYNTKWFDAGRCLYGGGSQAEQVPSLTAL
jgi:hypothetical protein